MAGHCCRACESEDDERGGEGGQHNIENECGKGAKGDGHGTCAILLSSIRTVPWQRRSGDLKYSSTLLCQSNTHDPHERRRARRHVAIEVLFGACVVGSVLIRLMFVSSIKCARHQYRTSQNDGHYWHYFVACLMCILMGHMFTKTEFT